MDAIEIGRADSSVSGNESSRIPSKEWLQIKVEMSLNFLTSTLSRFLRLVLFLILRNVFDASNFFLDLFSAGFRFQIPDKVFFSFSSF